MAEIMEEKTEKDLEYERLAKEIEQAQTWDDVCAAIGEMINFINLAGEGR